MISNRYQIIGGVELIVDHHIICPESSPVNCVEVVRLTLVVARILLSRWIDLHLGFNRIVAFCPFMHLCRLTKCLFVLN